MSGLVRESRHGPASCRIAVQGLESPGHMGFRQRRQPRFRRRIGRYQMEPQHAHEDQAKKVITDYPRTGGLAVPLPVQFFQ
jgi:hypothetical protein